MAYIKQIELPNGEVHTIYDEAAHNEINYIQQHLGLIKISVISEREFEADYEPNPSESFANTIYYVESADNPGTYTQYVCAERNGSWEWITISMDIDMSAYSLKRHTHTVSTTKTNLVRSQAYSGHYKKVLEQTTIIPIASGNGISVAKQTGETQYTLPNYRVIDVMTGSSLTGQDSDKYVSNVTTQNKTVHIGAFSAVTNIATTQLQVPSFAGVVNPQKVNYATGVVTLSDSSHAQFVKQLSFNSVVTGINAPDTVVTGVTNSSSNDDLLADVQVSNGVLSFGSKRLSTENITSSKMTGGLALMGRMITQEGYIGENLSTVIGSVTPTIQSAQTETIKAVDSVSNKYFAYDDAMQATGNTTITVPELSSVNVPEAGDPVIVATGGLLESGSEGGGSVVTSLTSSQFVTGLSNNSTLVVSNVVATTSTDIDPQLIVPSN